MINIEKNHKAPYNGVLISEDEAELFIRLVDKYNALKTGYDDYLNNNGKC